MAVLGPTASGKSALGLALAQRLDGEILCCDSMQVYRGMDIGTAKPTPAEQRLRPHHLLDLVSPGEPFHAAAWAEQARAVIGEISARGRLPIIVGGTGLYFRALTRGLFEAPPSDAEIRARHQAEAASSGVEGLYRRLQGIDPEAAATILPGDLLRISRALEVYEQTGVPISDLRRRGAPPLPLDLYTVVFDMPTPALRARITARVEAMMAAGFLDEVRALRAAGLGATRALQALGYRELGRHLDGALSLPEAVAEIQRTTTAYARRQRTWFRKEAATLRAEVPPDADALAAAIAAWACDRPPNQAG
ncbi:MAG TPA: tRNA (adenosine(37)-N6)-dimethylallyltransferase MiaA [Polyangia bacterium]|nr:tRNA (adenosine(37)-N6)-dimethylallyltransferase MiaA [Polyangia bacterium]